ncbi:alpha/beta fold hydrolase [Pseudarthrobacter sp. NPDC058196]|uniref:alpha/beta fold hydrolase n=1 Tax=Pseudarthrobacter sp. NPDC058196 TaxID=3346376 RepID=UPI0036DE27AA
MTAEQWIDARGVRTRVLTAGPNGAPPVLLLHDGGWGASAEMSWERVIPVLAREFQIVAPDMIGYGGTDKIGFFDRSGVKVRTEHLLAVLDRLGIESAAFVGNSFGGTIAVRALADPEARSRISAVVSISGTGGPWKTEKALSELTRFDGTRKDIERYVELLGIDPEDAEYVDRRLAWAREPGHYETMLAAHLQVPDVFPRSSPVSQDLFPESLRGVDTPTLLIAGRDDDLLLSEWTRHLADELAAAQIMVMPTGHSPNVSHPDDTARMLGQFLRSHLVPQPTAE